MNKKVSLFLSALVVMVIPVFAQNPNDFKVRVDSSNGVQTIVITGYTGNSTDVKIPSAINNIPVKIIGEQAFELKGLTSVVLPEGIERILARAFRGNKLNRVDIPKSVRIIADSAFDSNLLLKVSSGTPVTANTGAAGVRTGSGIYYTATPEEVSVLNTNPMSLDPSNKNAANKPGSGVGRPNERGLAASEAGSEPGYNQIRMQQNFYSPISVTLNSNVTVQPDKVPAYNNNVADCEEPEQTPVAKMPVADTVSDNAYYRETRQEAKQDTKQVTSQEAIQDTNQEVPPFTTVAANTESYETQEKATENRQVSSATRVFILGYTPDGFTEIKEYRGYQKSVAIPNQVGRIQITVIGKMSFMKKQLSSVSIPEGITTIGSSAFMSNSITSVIIPQSVNYIGHQAFTGNLLTSITIGSDVVLEQDSFGYRFLDYYKMAGLRAGTYIYKSGQWDLDGVERVNYNVTTQQQQRRTR
ncbi:MAG: hypothetical protein Ta2F_03320 [Termitinemataceae bacterium]|nr:MAG: hypothetical protein Ta2F_03320 [Termitinemataceae bacterium]